MIIHYNKLNYGSFFSPEIQGAPYNVLAQHHTKNRSNQPPDLARLTKAAVHQADNHSQDVPQESDGEDLNQDNARAARHSKSTGELKPDTMAYYRGTPWSAILTQAKIKYRRHIALNHGFPDRDMHLCNARDILHLAIEEYKEENGIVDESEFLLLHICTFTDHSIKISNQFVIWNV